MLITKFLITIPLSSKYAVLINTLNGAQFLISEEEFNLLKKWITKGILTPQTHFELEFMNLLQQHCFIFADIDEETEMEQNVLKNCRIDHHRHQADLKNVAVVITYDCNFRCPYCYEKDANFKSQKRISKEMVDSIFAHHHNIEGIMLYGGEPLLPANRSIIEYIISRAPDAQYGITTNGYYLEEYYSLLSRLNLDHIMVTLDGEEDVHNLSRIMPGQHGTYQKIVSGIKLYLKKGMKIKIRMNVNKQNIESCLIQRQKMIKDFSDAQFASTDCPFRMNGAGSSFEAVWFLGCNFLLVQRCQIAHIFAVHFQTV